MTREEPCLTWRGRDYQGAAPRSTRGGACGRGDEAQWTGSKWDLVAVGEVRVGDGDEAELLRREPQRKVAHVVLDEDAEEALHAPKNGAVDHDRLPLSRARVC